MTFRTEHDTKDELLNYWEHLVKLTFPPEAKIRTSEERGNFHIFVAWRLGDSELFTENWSREIEIVIPRETVEVYRRQNEKGRSIADKNLVAFLQLKKSDFHPEHDTPRYHVPPSEQWRIVPGDLIPG